MASKTDNASTFRLVAAFIAFLLISAAALIYLQGGSGSSAAPQLAALSQAIPAQAARALAGEDGAFDRMDSSIKKIAALRRVSVTPGRSSDWRQLESQAAAIIARRSEIEAANSAAARIVIDA